MSDDHSFPQIAYGRKLTRTLAYSFAAARAELQCSAR
jgi:hypothetical protein